MLCPNPAEGRPASAATNRTADATGTRQDTFMAGTLSPQRRRRQDGFEPEAADAYWSSTSETDDSGWPSPVALVHDRTALVGRLGDSRRARSWSHPATVVPRVERHRAVPGFQPRARSGATDGASLRDSHDARR